MSTSYVKYKIILSGNISEELRYSILMYWQYDGFKFKFTNEELNLEKEILENILKYSSVILSFQNCIFCFDLINLKVIGRDEFINAIKLYPRVCEICKEFSPNYDDNCELVRPLNSLLKELSAIELKVLTGIVKLRSKKLIYRHIFNNDISDSSIWNIINSLQRKGLIWIVRDGTWKIESFQFNNELTNHL